MGVYSHYYLVFCRGHWTTVSNIETRLCDVYVIYPRFQWKNDRIVEDVCWLRPYLIRTEPDLDVKSGPWNHVIVKNRNAKSQIQFHVNKCKIMIKFLPTWQNLFFYQNLFLSKYRICPCFFVICFNGELMNYFRSPLTVRCCWLSWIRWIRLRWWSHGLTIPDLVSDFLNKHTWFWNRFCYLSTKQDQVWHDCKRYSIRPLNSPKYFTYFKPSVGCGLIFSRYYT